MQAAEQRAVRRRVAGLVTRRTHRAKTGNGNKGKGKESKQYKKDSGQKQGSLVKQQDESFGNLQSVEGLDQTLPLNQSLAATCDNLAEEMKKLFESVQTPQLPPIVPSKQVTLKWREEINGKRVNAELGSNVETRALAELPQSPSHKSPKNVSATSDEVEGKTKGKSAEKKVVRTRAPKNVAEITGKAVARRVTGARKNRNGGFEYALECEKEDGTRAVYCLNGADLKTGVEGLIIQFYETTARFAGNLPCAPTSGLAISGTSCFSTPSPISSLVAAPALTSSSSASASASGLGLGLGSGPGSGSGPASGTGSNSGISTSTSTGTGIGPGSGSSLRGNTGAGSQINLAYNQTSISVSHLLMERPMGEPLQIADLLQRRNNGGLNTDGKSEVRDNNSLHPGPSPGATTSICTSSSMSNTCSFRPPN